MESPRLPTVAVFGLFAALSFIARPALPATSGRNNHGISEPTAKTSGSKRSSATAKPRCAVSWVNIGKVQDQKGDKFGADLAALLRKYHDNLPSYISDAKLDATRITFGDLSAPIHIEEFSDFVCGYCRKVQVTFKTLLLKYGDQISLTYKHLPIFGDKSRQAAYYIEALASQSSEKAKEFHQRVYDEQQQFLDGGDMYLSTLSEQLGADMPILTQSLKSKKIEELVESDISRANDFKLTGVPGFAINRLIVSGALDYDFFDYLIEGMLVVQGGCPAQNKPPPPADSPSH
jgi:protein-disulfide isomerase